MNQLRLITFQLGKLPTIYHLSYHDVKLFSQSLYSNGSVIATVLLLFEKGMAPQANSLRTKFLGNLNGTNNNKKLNEFEISGSSAEVKGKIGADIQNTKFPVTSGGKFSESVLANLKRVRYTHISGLLYHSRINRIGS